MNNLSFENGSIIFSEPNAQTALLGEILQQSPILTGVSILSLASYLRGFDNFTQDPLTFFCETAKICTLMKDEMEVLGDMLKYPQTIQEIADFVLEMDVYGADIEKLPGGSAKERDLKRLAQKIATMELPGKSTQRWFSELLNETKTKKVYLSRSDENLITSLRYNELIIAGATPIKFVSYEPVLELFHAVNARTEALGVAQFIASDPMLFNKQSIVCLDPAANLTVLKANFDRLGIPYTVLSQSFLIEEAKLFIQLLRFCENKTIERWVDVLNCAPLRFAFPLVNYILDFGIGIDLLSHPLTHIKDCMDQKVLWDYLQVKTYLEMEQEAENIRLKTDEILTKAVDLDLSTWRLYVESVFSFCVSICSATDEGKTALLQIKSTLEKTIPKLEGLENATDLLCFALDGLRQKVKNPSNGVIITDLDHFHLPGIQRMFVLSAGQKNYPQFDSRNGLIDENYREHSGLPSLQDRYDHHMKRIGDLFTWSPELIFSYATGNYEGKSNELAFEVETFCQKYGVKPKRWKIFEKDGLQKPEPELKQETYKSLLFPKGHLKGSVSAIERFFECPYKYFLSVGLHLRTKPNAKIEVNIIGTLMHAIFENAIKENGENYASLSDTEIEALAQPYFRDIIRLYPQHLDYIATLKDRMLKQVRRVFDRLAMMESESTFKPTNTEYEFKRDIQIHSEIVLKLGGFIDRIDKNTSQLRIMDYKSSGKRLYPRKVLTGQQLQLLTYMWIASQDMKLEAAGAYYISLKQENISVSAGKLGLRPIKLDEYGNEEWEEEAWKTHRLKGWTFTDPSTLDFKGRNIENLRVNKDGNVVVFGGSYRIELVEKLMNELYAYFGTHLFDGDISRTCTPHACEYCDYVRLCQFRGDTVNVKTRTSVKNLKKGDE